MKKIVIILSLVLLLILIICFYVLLTNKTFFKNTYIGIGNQEIFIPKYSFFVKESGMNVASFKSLKSESSLKEEIKNYMKDFEYFENELTYGYRKGKLVIKDYKVINEGTYRRIYITYWTTN